MIIMGEIADDCHDIMEREIEELAVGQRKNTYVPVGPWSGVPDDDCMHGYSSFKCPYPRCYHYKFQQR